jgi:glutamate racemase
MIGIFDSGAGGLTVYKEIAVAYPEKQIIYLGDLANLPYGSKSPEMIRRIAEKNIDFLISKGAKIIVIACNTASGRSPLLKKRPVPILNVIDPAVKLAAESTKNNKVGVIGTLGTINSGAYEERIKNINPKISTVGEATPLLVPLVEENWIDKIETKRILKHYLRPLKAAGIDTLILGCTHYPLLQPQIKRIMGPKIKIISSAQAVVGELEKTIKNKKIKLNPGVHQFYITDYSLNLDKISQKFLGKKIKFEKVHLF